MGPPETKVGSISGMDLVGWTHALRAHFWVLTKSLGMTVFRHLCMLWPAFSPESFAALFHLPLSRALFQLRESTFVNAEVLPLETKFQISG